MRTIEIDEDLVAAEVDVRPGHVEGREVELLAMLVADDLVRARVGEHEGVGAGAAVQRVVAGAAVEHVVAGAAAEAVVALAAAQVVLAVAADEQVIAFAADERVVAVVAGERVGRAVADQRVMAATARGVLDNDPRGRSCSRRKVPST